MFQIGKEESFLLQITTHDVFLSNSETKRLQDKLNCGLNLVHLEEFETEQEFEDYINDYFSSVNSSKEPQILVFQTDGNSELLSCAKYLVHEAFVNADRKLERCYRIVFVVRVIRSADYRFLGFEAGEWQSLHIEELTPKIVANFCFMDDNPVSKLLRMTELVDGKQIEKHNTHVDVVHILQRSLPKAAALVTETGGGDSRRVHRIEVLASLLQKVDESFTRQFQNGLCDRLADLQLEREEHTKKYSSVSNLADCWLSREAAKHEHVIECGTFK